MNTEAAADAVDSPESLIHEDLTYTVIGRSFRVQNKLGFGYVENVYLGALEHELRKAGLVVEREVPIAVWYDGVIVGTYRVDLLVERKVIVETKACPSERGHEAQLLSYLVNRHRGWLVDLLWKEGHVQKVDLQQLEEV
jgi:GxxExxY protein